MTAAPSTRLAEALDAMRLRMDRALEGYLPREDAPEARLVDAMRYATLDGGKRLRPLLVFASGALFDLSEAKLERLAVAVELVHCYSLVHDDLPAMDDAALRRGRKTVHKAFDDATAVLVGDALLPLAFEVLAHPATSRDGMIRADLVLRLAQAAGMHGMVGGQMMDMRGDAIEWDAARLTRMQQLKTGALIEFAVEAPALLAQASERDRLHLAAYAHDLGIAFQIADDLLNLTASAAETGKDAGNDAAAGKPNFVTLMGAERARAQAALLIDQAVAHLEAFGSSADMLREIAYFAVARAH